MSEAGFYVTMKRGSRTAWLLGPYPDHKTAERLVPEGRRLACQVDPFCGFDAFGTSRLERPEDRELPPGKLNHLLAPGVEHEGDPGSAVEPGGASGVIPDTRETGSAPRLS